MVHARLCAHVSSFVGWTRAHVQGEEYRRVYPIFIGLLAGVVVGAPLLMLVALLYFRRTHVLHEAHHLRRYGVLYQSFEKMYFFWVRSLSVG